MQSGNANIPRWIIQLWNFGERRGDISYPNQELNHKFHYFFSSKFFLKKKKKKSLSNNFEWRWCKINRNVNRNYRYFGGDNSEIGFIHGCGRGTWHVDFINHYSSLSLHSGASQQLRHIEMEIDLRLVLVDRRLPYHLLRHRGQFNLDHRVFQKQVKLSLFFFNTFQSHDILVSGSDIAFPFYISFLFFFFFRINPLPGRKLIPLKTILVLLSLFHSLSYNYFIQK